MATEIEIKSNIVSKVGTTNYSIWKIGITADPDRRRQEHARDGKDTSHWSNWLADSEMIAREAERYFVEKGMKGDVGGGVNPRYVNVD